MNGYGQKKSENYLSIVRGMGSKAHIPLDTDKIRRRFKAVFLISILFFMSFWMRNRKNVNYSVRPAGMYLIAYHKGKWQTLEDTYKKILEYGKENKIQLGAHCYEDILFDSLTMSEEEEYLTRIVFEIQSSKSGK